MCTMSYLIEGRTKVVACERMSGQGIESWVLVLVSPIDLSHVVHIGLGPRAVLVVSHYMMWMGVSRE